MFKEIKDKKKFNNDETDFFLNLPNPPAKKQIWMPSGCL